MEKEMEVHQELPILENVVKQFFDNFAEQATDNNKLPIELTNTTGTYFDQHMNDDCLLEIFSVESLTLMDLCSLAETCKRFQQIIQRIFPKKLSIEYDTSDGGCNVISHNYIPSECRPSHDINRILKNSGSILSAVSISISSTVTHFWRYEHVGREEKERSDASNFILNLIEKHCTDTLLFLKIDGLKIGKVKLKRLRFLEIGEATIVDSKTFTDFESLEELTLIWLKNCNEILENFFPGLKRLAYQNLDLNPFNRSLSTFISLHKNLETIKLDIDGDRDATLIMQAIASSCTKLKELNARMGRMNTTFLPLQQLKSLQTLILHQASCENFDFVPSLTELRELHLYRCNLPSDSNQFDRLIQLTKLTLHLDANSTIEVVDVIIKRLMNLEELEVSEELVQAKIFVLDEETFTKIVGIVRERPKILTLKCKFNLNNCINNEKVKLLPLH